MRVVITAGGTSEMIDSVRSITNKSSGKLGSLIAENFYSFDNNIEVVYICPENTILPTHFNSSKFRIINVTNTQSLKETIETILNTEKVDVFIHSMAVSDYSVNAIFDTETLTALITDCINKHKNIDDINLLSEKISAEIYSTHQDYTNTKFSSKHENSLISMTKNEKIIKYIKEIQPTTILVGFKLLSNVSQEELITTASNLLRKNNCDFVLVNDSSNITSNRHRGIFIDDSGRYVQLETKEEISNEIVIKTIEKFKNSK